MSSPAFHRHQHLGHRHAGDDFQRRRHAQPRPAAPPTRACYTISWDEESALALICSGTARDAPSRRAIAEAADARCRRPSAVGHANAEELGAILDTTAEGILMFDAEGNINSCNRSAEALVRP